MHKTRPHSPRIGLRFGQWNMTRSSSRKAAADTPSTWISARSSEWSAKKSENSARKPTFTKNSSPCTRTRSLRVRVGAAKSS